MVPILGKSRALGLGEWVIQGPSLDVGSPLEVETPLEVAAGAGIGQAKRVQGGLEMGPGQELEERGPWMVSIWRRGHGAWRCTRAVLGGRQQERLLWHTIES